MEQREGEHQPIFRSPSPGDVHSLRARQRVAVTEDRSLRPAGRPRGEHQHRGIVGDTRVEPRRRPWHRGLRGTRAHSGRRGARAGSSSTASFGRASVHTLPSSFGPNTVFTGTTIAPSRSAPTCASTRSADGAQLITTRSPGSTPAPARRDAAIRERSSTSAALSHGVAASRSTGAAGAAAHRAAHARGSDSALVRSVGSPSNPWMRQAERSSRGPGLTSSAEVRLDRLEGERRDPVGASERSGCRPAPASAPACRSRLRRGTRRTRHRAPRTSCGCG